MLAAVSGSLSLALIQIAPMKQANPAVNFECTMEASLAVPASVERMLNAACKDCHSNETRWPWYAKIPPVSWIVTDEVAGARRALNFSEWPTQGSTKPVAAIRRLTASCAQVEGKHMPPAVYGRMHPAARLQPEQVEELCDWAGDQARLLRSQAGHQSKPFSP